MFQSSTGATPLLIAGFSVTGTIAITPFPSVRFFMVLAPVMSVHISGTPRGAAGLVRSTVPTKACVGPIGMAGGLSAAQVATILATGAGWGITVRIAPVRGSTVTQTCADSISFKETFRVTVAAGRAVSAGRTRDSGAMAGVAPAGSVGLAPLSAVMATNCITCPVVPGSASGTAGNPPT